MRVSTFRGNDEARALGIALRDAEARGQRVPCAGLDAATVRPSTCRACPLAVREACGDYGRAIRGVGTFGGVRMSGQRTGA